MTDRKDEEMYAPAELVAFDRGQALKRYVRAAAALRGMYDDTAIGQAVGRTRITVGKWWGGAKPEPDAVRRLAEATGLSTDELTRYVYFDGPAAPLARRTGLCVRIWRPRRHPTGSGSPRR